MPIKTHPDQIKAAFELFLEYNGERFDLIEAEMRKRGWTSFSKQNLLPKGIGKNFREGWIQKYGWDNALKMKLATIGTLAMTSAESLLFETETLRKAVFIELEANKLDKDKLYIHDKLTQRSIEILAKLNDARDNYANFLTFFKKFSKYAMEISPNLAKELVKAEEGIIAMAREEFKENEAS